MAIDLPDWHQRYLQQASWTSQIRLHLYDLIEYAQVQTILDIGSGTGALLPELTQQFQTPAVGLDIDPANLSYSINHHPLNPHIQGNAHALPFRTGTVQICVFHFVLLWIRHPENVLREAVRVTQPGGYVIAMAEPDYGGRIDYPAELEPMASAQTRSLARQGADPNTGRKLRALFSHCMLDNIEAGVLGGHWKGSQPIEKPDLEWEVLQHDLAGMVPPNELEKYREIDQRASDAGSRILYVPTFYAIGRKP